MAETERADKQVQSDLGLDIHIPNFLPFFNPFETADVATQTGTVVPEPGGSASTPARREKRMDRIINEFHRRALYVEQDIRYLERKYQDEALVKELRETFEEWDARMKPFQFITSCDSSTQTGMVALASDTALHLEDNGDADPTINASSVTALAAGAWRRLERCEIEAGLPVRVTTASSRNTGCRGRIRDAYWACDDLMSGEVLYVCCLGFQDGAVEEFSLGDIEVLDSSAPAGHPT